MTVLEDLALASEASGKLERPTAGHYRLPLWVDASPSTDSLGSAISRHWRQEWKFPDSGRSSGRLALIACFIGSKPSAAKRECVDGSRAVRAVLLL